MRLTCIALGAASTLDGHLCRPHFCTAAARVLKGTRLRKRLEHLVKCLEAHAPIVADWSMVENVSRKVAREVILGFEKARAVLFGRQEQLVVLVDQTVELHQLRVGQ